jgi:hypothetical protein
MRTIFVLAALAILVVLVLNAPGDKAAQASSSQFAGPQPSEGCVSRVEARPPRNGVDVVTEESDAKAHRLVIPMALLVAIVECPVRPGGGEAPRELRDPAEPSSGATQATSAPTWPEAGRSHHALCAVSTCPPSATERPVLLSP